MVPTKEQILSAKDSPLERADVPEWGEGAQVFVRTMSGAERDAWEVEQFDINGKDVTVNRRNLRARLLVKCVVDESGKRIFEDGEADALGSRSSRVIDRIYAVAQRLNGLSKKDEDELVKN